jgi:hypothetical protein
MTTGIDIIAAERKAHFTREGFTADRDAQYTKGELAEAAACYATRSLLRNVRWPWDDSWWKPSPDNRIKELAKAGALIAAEIDRLLAKEQIKDVAKLIAKELP